MDRNHQLASLEVIGDIDALSKHDAKTVVGEIKRRARGIGGEPVLLRAACGDTMRLEPIASGWEGGGGRAPIGVNERNRPPVFHPVERPMPFQEIRRT